MLPIFAFLNMFMVMRPTIVMIASIVLLLTTLIIYNIELGMIYNKEHNVDDKGINNGKRVESAGKEKTTKKEKNTKKVFLIVLITMFALPILSGGGLFFLFFQNKAPLLVGMVIALVPICIVIFLIKKKYKKLEMNKSGLVLYISGIVTAIAGLIMVVNPVADMWYYGATIGVILTAIIIFIDIIRYYNRIAMRRLPQFDKMGGDDGAF